MVLANHDLEELIQTESQIRVKQEDSTSPGRTWKKQESQSQTQTEWRSPVGLEQLAKVIESESLVLANQDLEELTQTESQIPVKQEDSTSPGRTWEKPESQSQTQTEWRSPVGLEQLAKVIELEQLAKVIESESLVLANQDLEELTQTESQIPVKQEDSTSPGRTWEKPESQSQTQTEWRSPVGLEQLAKVIESESLVLANQDLEELTQTESQIPVKQEDSTSPGRTWEKPESQSQTQTEWRSPLGLKQLAKVVESESLVLQTQDLEALTQTESQIRVKQEDSTSPGRTWEKPESQSQTQTEWRSRLGLEQLANVIESESLVLANQDLEELTQTESQISVKQEDSTSPGRTWEKPESQSQTQTEWRSPLGLKQLAKVVESESLVLQTQDLEALTQTESQIPVKQEDSISPGRTWEKQESQNQTQTESQSPVGLEQLANVIEPDELGLVNRDLENLNQLALYSFFKEKHHQAGEMKIEIEPNTARSINDNQEIDIDLIMEAITQEVNREYRRFYGG